jgi:hypothetical protein
MCVAATSLLRDSYHHSSKCFSSAVLQFQPISLFNRRYCSLDICVILHISVFIVFSLLISSFLLLNLDQWYQSGLLFIYFSSCMSPTRSGYKKLGLEPIEPLQDRSRRARKQPMGDENKYDGAGDPIKMLLEEALMRQRNEMMDNFVQILRRLPHRRSIFIKRPCNPLQGTGKF